MSETAVRRNPLEYEKIGRLLIKFAVPSIVGQLVIAFYNIVDQLFIGNVIGTLGNTATGLFFPFVNACLALGLGFGVGGAAAFNLKMGAGEKDEAPYYFGNALISLFLSGVLLCLVAQLFMPVILPLFGASKNVMEMATDYARILAFGFPLAIIGSGSGNLLRADGRPHLTMVCNLTGCLLNIGLDAWFIIGLRWGIKGAAIATVIGQFVGAVLAIIFLTRCRTFKLQWKHLIPKPKYFGRDIKLGVGPMLNQLTMMVVQIATNSSLSKYGEQSIYGPDIPLACSSIIQKVASMFLSVNIGLCQATQPIVSFNYGAKNYRRVKEALYRAMCYSAVVSTVAFIIFQTIPDKILLLFGRGNDLYIEYGCMHFRITIMLVIIIFVQAQSSNFFTAIGKPLKGTFLSLTRSVIFFLPILFIFRSIWGIYGIIWTTPTADIFSITVSIIVLALELRRPEFRNEKGVWKSIFKKEKVQEIN